MNRNLITLSKRIGKILKSRNLSLSVAESCTGGLLSSYITDTPGSSKYFLLGIVAYSRGAKEELLKIPRASLRKYSPVSGKISQLMAKKIKKKVSSDIGIGITGYAGPTGGTKVSPTGTVYIALVFKNKTYLRRYLFKGKRGTVKYKTANAALNLLNDVLQVPR